MRKTYDFFSFFLIPALTFFLAEGFSLTDTNFSVIGNREGRRILFLLWGAVIGNYFYFYVRDLMELGGCEDRTMQRCLFLAFFCFLCGIGIPYLPSRVPILSCIHVWISFSSTVFLFITLHRFLFVLEKRESCRLVSWRLFQLAVSAGAGILYCFAGMVSSLLEIYVTFTGCLYLALFQSKIEKIRLSNH